MAQIQIQIASKNNQPPSQSGWLQVDLDYGNNHIFTVANFTTETTPPYQDPEGDAIDSIKVSSLPTDGLLKLNNINVSVDDVITATQIGNSELVYESANIQSGYSDSYMSFLVSDIGSNSFTSSPEIVSFKVSGNVNQPPINVGDGYLDIMVGQVVTFTRVMLTSQLNPPYEDPEGNPALNLLVEKVPLSGELRLNNILVVDDQEISFSDIDLGLLKYHNMGTPANDSLEGFQFKISDTGSGEYVG